MRNFLIMVFAVALLFMTTRWLILKASDDIPENPCFYGCPTEVNISNEGKR